MKGILFIVCAPSGAGKTTLVSALLKADARVRLSVSYTTRAPRPGEVDGQDYHFVSTGRFHEMAERGEFLESARVHGNDYGTSQAWINEQHEAGNDILLEIDWQGAQQVRRLMPQAVGIFILPPTLDALLDRLNARAQDPPDVIARRLTAARTEIAHAAEFDYVIINENFEVAAAELAAVVCAERLRTTRQLALHRDLIDRMK